MPKLGTKCKTYIDASGGVTTWVEVVNVEDATLNQDRNAGEVMNRGSDWVKVLTGKKNAVIDVTLTLNVADAQYIALRNAYNNDSDVGVAVMSGVITTVGEEGFQAACKIVSFNRTETLQDVVKIAMQLRPSAASTIEPAYVLITV